jgi:hypothetical protein
MRGAGTLRAAATSAVVALTVLTVGVSSAAADQTSCGSVVTSTTIAHQSSSPQFAITVTVFRIVNGVGELPSGVNDANGLSWSGSNKHQYSTYSSSQWAPPPGVYSPGQHVTVHIYVPGLSSGGCNITISFAA